MMAAETLSVFARLRNLKTAFRNEERVRVSPRAPSGKIPAYKYPAAALACIAATDEARANTVAGWAMVPVANRDGANKGTRAGFAVVFLEAALIGVLCPVRIDAAA
jgi:hypothetical protein